MKERSSSKRSPKRMAKANRKQEPITIGMDLGDKNSCYCVLGEDGQVLREGHVATTRKAMTHVFNSIGRAGIAIEGWYAFAMGEAPTAGFRTRGDRSQSKAGQVKMDRHWICSNSPPNWSKFSSSWGHVSVQTTELYLGCTQRIASAVNDKIGIEPPSGV